MNSYQKSTLELPHKARPTGIERVRFHDGMLVSADDLDAAAAYPVSLLQSVLRAYLGCGVVCGLELRPTPTIGHEQVWTLCVDRGMALDCQGYPIELVAPVVLDLSPDACGCETPPPTVLIAVRRVTLDSDTRDPCSCGDDGPHVSCRRARDQILVKAFTDAELKALPGSVCQLEPAKDEQQNGVSTHVSAVGGPPAVSQAPAAGQASGGRGDPCQVMKECPGCACDAVWVLLGAVTLDPKAGITAIETDRRRWVKPVAALCALSQVTGILDRLTGLEKDVRTLRTAPASTGSSSADPAASGPATAADASTSSTPSSATTAVTPTPDSASSSPSTSSTPPPTT
jgi:hypothetical protein